MMSEVKRYACITASGIGSVKVCESPNGKFIMYEDYVELQEKLHTAEVKLAELQKQEPIGYTTERAATYEVWNSGSACFWKDKDNGDFPLYARPVPAVSLAELVPAEVTYTDATTEEPSSLWAMGFNACRAAILRNIEKL